VDWKEVSCVWSGSELEAKSGRVCCDAGEKTEPNTRRRPALRGTGDIIVVGVLSAWWKEAEFDVQQAQVAGSWRCAINKRQ
jgi:hypothetical protein